MSFQEITIIGNLGRDPEMRYTPGGKAVTNFTVAANRKFTTGGEKREETVWFRISTWGPLAETCSKFLSKGRGVVVVGRMTADPENGGPKIWFDKETNDPRTAFEVNAHHVTFLSGGERKENPVNASVTEEGEEIPF